MKTRILIALIINTGGWLWATVLTCLLDEFASNSELVQAIMDGF